MTSLISGEAFGEWFPGGARQGYLFGGGLLCVRHVPGVQGLIVVPEKSRAQRCRNGSTRSGRPSSNAHRAVGSVHEDWPRDVPEDRSKRLLISFDLQVTQRFEGVCHMEDGRARAVGLPCECEELRPGTPAQNGECVHEGVPRNASLGRADRRDLLGEARRGSRGVLSRFLV